MTTATKKKRARDALLPNPPVPASSVVGVVGGVNGRTAAATFRLMPTGAMPPQSLNEPGPGGRHVTSVTHPRRAAIGPIIDALRELQVRRRAQLRARIRLVNQACGLARRALGWRAADAESSRAKMNAAARKLVTAIERGEAPEDGASITEDIEVWARSREPIEDRLRKIERDMRAYAEALPVWQHFKDVNGFGPLGLAIIIGESGDLSNYSGVAKLWKRLGLAPPSEYVKPCKDGRECAQPPKERRSAIWTVSDSLRRQPNIYTDVYNERRLYEIEKHPEWDKGINKKTGKRKIHIHAHRRAQRYMEKRLIKHIWCKWNSKEASS